MYNNKHISRSAQRDQARAVMQQPSKNAQPLATQGRTVSNTVAGTLIFPMDTLQSHADAKATLAASPSPTPTQPVRRYIAPGAASEITSFYRRNNKNASQQEKVILKPHKRIVGFTVTDSEWSSSSDLDGNDYDTEGTSSGDL